MNNTLIIGTRRYSSWSLRGWLAVRLADLDVDIVAVPLDGSGASPAVQAASPSGKVPYLVHQGVHIWESLAIVEYCAEIERGLWPADRAARAQARAVAAEMHAGFRDLRSAMPMNIGRSAPGHRTTQPVRRDIARIEQLWTSALMKSHGPFLFGTTLGAADAMFAPIVARFVTYEPELCALSQGYCRAVWEHQMMRRWIAEAAAEPAEWQVAKYEAALNQ